MSWEKRWRVLSENHGELYRNTHTDKSSRPELNEPRTGNTTRFFYFSFFHWWFLDYYTFPCSTLAKRLLHLVVEKEFFRNVDVFVSNGNVSSETPKGRVVVALLIVLNSIFDFFLFSSEKSVFLLFRHWKPQKHFKPCDFLTPTETHQTHFAFVFLYPFILGVCVCVFFSSLSTSSFPESNKKEDSQGGSLFLF